MRESDETIEVKVKWAGGSDKSAGSVKIQKSETVSALKAAIHTEFGSQVKRIIYQGRLLKDEQNLSDCKVQDGHTVVVQAEKGVSTGAAAAAGGTTSSTAAAVPPGTSAGAAAAAPAPAPAAAAAAGTGGADMQQAIAQALMGQLGGSAGGGSSGSEQSLRARMMEGALAVVRQQPPMTARKCLSTLMKVVDNILSHPMEDKYRKIKKGNATFQRQVGAVPGAEDCMRALGFQEEQGSAQGEEAGVWTITPNAAAWEVLQSGKAAMQRTLDTLPAATPTPGAAGAGAGLGGLPTPPAAGGMGMGMGDGMGGMDMDAVARMASDPATMEAMMRDPQVQQMMGQNPQAAQAMQQVARNPAMLQQAMQMMRNNPAMMQQAQQMMAGGMGGMGGGMRGMGGGMGGMGGGMGGLGGMGAGLGMPPAPTPTPAPGGAAAQAQPPPAGPPAAAPAGGAVAGGGGGGDGDEGKTEEELMAEAIARSLQEM